ncbi:MAG: aspartyl protease family protein [Candidatus Baltobacteraceae bacterium]
MRRTHDWSQFLKYCGAKAALALVLLLCDATASRAAAPQADALFKLGDFTAAKSAYAAALKTNPTDTDAELGIARVSLYENDLDGASTRLDAILKADPKHALAARLVQTIAERRRVIASAAALGVPAPGVTVPFIASEPLPLMQFTVGGRAGNFLLDTGGPDVVLDPEFAKELGLTVVAGQMGTFAGGQTAQVRQASLPSMEVGPITLRDLKVDILPSRNLPFFGSRRVDGVVGTVFLSRFLSTIDYPNHQLILRPRTAAARAGPSTTMMPMWLVGDHFIFARGSVNDLAKQLFFIDSGLAGSGFAPETSTIAAAKVRTFPDKEQTGIGGGGPVKFIPVVADKLCLSTACQRDIPGVYTPSGSPLQTFPFTSAGIVSHSYLEHYAVTLDFAAMHLILQNGGAAPANART